MKDARWVHYAKRVYWRMRGSWSWVLSPPRKLRVTREGKVFLGVTIGVGLAAVNTGNNLLYLVLGLLLSLVTLSGVLSEIALRGLDFRRRLPRRAFAGVPALVEIEVHNRKRYAPSYSIEVEDRVEGRRTDKRCYFLKISAGARQTAAYRRVAPVRGVERYRSLRVATRFPFGLFEKWREVTLPEDQLVFPYPRPAERRSSVARVLGDLVTHEERGHGEVDGVRDLVDGDPVRDIHWPKTAAMDKVVARERRREGARLVRIEVPNRAPSEPAGLKDFTVRLEDDIRRAAFVALDALRQGAQVQLLAQDAPAEGPRGLLARPSTHAADRVLAFLARLPPLPAGPEDPDARGP
ncbi:MAG: DUF58 domain-containing protein [Deltaproteobacteria bacterium]|nr:DUF58 domain-containing protein [Deltaproteobacteria bacterium]